MMFEKFFCERLWLGGMVYVQEVNMCICARECVDSQ